MRRFSPIILDALGFPIGGYGVAFGRRISALGKRRLGSTGKRLISATACCFIRSKNCADDSNGPWLNECAIRTLGFPYYFCDSGAIYYVDDDSERSNLTQTTITPSISASGCADPICLYIQAKKCSDGSDANLWFPPGTTLPLYFTKSGVDYFVNVTCNTNATPGTLAASYTTQGGCPGCPSCTGRTAARYALTFSGVTMNACSGTGATIYGTTGDLNGTFDLDVMPGCGVDYEFDTAVVAANTYTGTCATLTGTFSFLTTFGFNSGGSIALTVSSAASPANPIFQGSASGPRDCLTPFTITNTISSSGRFGGGGSLLVTPL